MKTFALALVAFSLSVSCCAQSPTGQVPLSHESRIDLGGFKLFTSESGAGSPTVVFESGMGEDTSTWQQVQPAIAKFTQTFVYDRAGLGKSESSPKPRSVEQLVSELHQLLQATHLAPPYILVGHSLGGALIQLYAHDYQDEIAGLVFVDPEDGRLLDQLQARMSPEDWQKRKEALDRVMPAFSPTQTAELEATKVSGKTLAAALPLPKVPVVLLTGTLKDPDFPGNPLEQDIKLEIQNQLVSQIPGARHVLVPQSRHYIQDDAPDLVIEAIQDVWTEAKVSTKTPHP